MSVVSRKECDDVMSKLGFYLQRWRDDPVAYAIECCGDTPTHQQASLLRAVAKEKLVSVRSGHGVGKTRVLALLIHWYLDTHRVPGVACRVPCTAPAGSSLTDCLWTELAAVRDRKLPWLKDRYEINNERMHCVEGSKDWFSVVRTSRKDNPDALQGFHRCLFVIDEASGVPDEVMEVLRGAMGDEGTYAVMTGNPTRLDGYFYESHTKGRTWHKMVMPSTDSLTDTEYGYEYCDPRGDVQKVLVRGRQRREWVESMKQEFGENSDTFKIRVLGEFGSGSVEKLLTRPIVTAGFAVAKREKEDSLRFKILGVDVAWTGSDDSAIVGRHGEYIELADSWHGCDTVETAARVKAVYDEWHPHRIYIDTIGVGAGVYDILRRAGLPVFAVATNIPAPDDNDAACKTLRDWLWWRCRKFFKTMTPGLKGPEEGRHWQMLVDELVEPSFSFKTGELRVESKDDMKKRGVRSPNIADALVLTLMADFVMKTAKTMQADNADSMRRRKKGLPVRRSWACV